MERSVEVVVSELQAASERLRDAGQRLQDGLSSVDLETRQLLGSGWKGDAASAYGPAWDKWHDGAGQVVRGLQTMADLLSLAGKEYAKTDQQSGARRSGRRTERCEHAGTDHGTESETTEVPCGLGSTVGSTGSTGGRARSGGIRSSGHGSGSLGLSSNG